MAGKLGTWRGALAVGAGICAAASYVVPYILSDHLWAWVKWSVIGGGCISALLAVSLPVVEIRRMDVELQAARQVAQGAQANAQAAHADERTILQDFLGPISTIMSRIATAANHAERAANKKQLIEKIVQAAAHAVGPDRTRSCFFEHEPKTEDRPRSLECKGTYAGRGDVPRTVFQEGSEPGDSVLACLDQRDHYICPDVDEYPPPGWSSARPSSYKTFINVPVAADDRSLEPLGMLTIDSLRAGDLTELDIAFMTYLAQTLAAGLSING